MVLAPVSTSLATTDGDGSGLAGRSCVLAAQLSLFIITLATCCTSLLSALFESLASLLIASAMWIQAQERGTPPFGSHDGEPQHLQELHNNKCPWLGLQTPFTRFCVLDHHRNNQNADWVRGASRRRTSMHPEPPMSKSCTISVRIPFQSLPSKTPSPPPQAPLPPNAHTHAHNLSHIDLSSKSYGTTPSVSSPDVELPTVCNPS